jgi:hypothetical protein
MKTFWTALLSVSVLVGCKSRSKPDGEAASAPSSAASTNFVVTPSIDLIGRVSTVNTKDRFVVVSYPTSLVPERGQKLNVYREGRKVGELRVGGFSQDNLTTADILAGEIYVGDDVRIN